MEEDVLPEVQVEQVTNEMSETENSTTVTDESQTKLSPTVDSSTEQIMNSGDSVGIPKLEPFATTSKSKHISVANETKNKGIQEFVRILRPHLPRKSKNKAYKLLQNIAKGIIVESSFQRRIRQRTPKKRPQRKPRGRNPKSLSGVRKNNRTVYDSTDSCPSDASCPRCGYSCCKISRF